MTRIPLILLLLMAMRAGAQEKESFYVFDAQWRPTKVDSAHYFLRIHQVNDTCWQWDYYNFNGPLLKTEQFRDDKGKIMHGINRYYKEDGRLDSTGMYRDGTMNGEAVKIKDDSLHVLMVYKYKGGLLIETIDPSKRKTDSAKEDSVERESEYPGGVGKWMRYVNRNIKYPDRAVNGKIEGVVRIVFIVGKQGEVLEPYVGKSVEYSLDEESLRIVRGSGKWTPAVQFGKVVKSYKIQPIDFRLN
jgi:protein TonB